MKTERLTPVCQASGDRLTAYASGIKDGNGKAACPRCQKVVKLRKGAMDRWPNTIPHHHAGLLAGMAFVDATDAARVQKIQLLRQLKSCIDADIAINSIPSPSFSLFEWKAIGAALGEVS